MGLYDRDYTQADFRSHYHGAPQMRMSFPRPTPVVKWLLIVNIMVFLSGFLIPKFGAFLLYWFSVWPKDLGMSMQIWRLITYQFLHGGLGHIFWNMFILFFFGPMLERLWGSRKFLTFYLVCGATGGIFYPILAHIGWLGVAPLIGASGSILGMLAAAAILFPKMIVYVFGVRLCRPDSWTFSKMRSSSNCRLRCAAIFLCQTPVCTFILNFCRHFSEIT